MLGYDGRVIAGDRECGDYFVVDQRAGRERGLILMHLVRRYETAEAATEASKSLLSALGVLKYSEALNAEVVARLGLYYEESVVIRGTEARVLVDIGCETAGCTVELLVSH